MKGKTMLVLPPQKLLRSQEDGSILVTMLSIMIFLTVMLMGLAVLASSNISRSRGRIMLLQAQYSAESGADAAIAILNSGNTTYAGTSTDTQVLQTAQYKATYSTTVTAGTTSKQRVIVAKGKVYAPANSPTPTYTRTIRVTAERSATSFTTGILSHNILYVQSGVKNLSAKDIYVNGFIQLNKNTTKLTAENITAAGKNTGATNCSIGGSGSLAKPSTFVTPGQTKTNITVAYNNCLTPPGNTSNSDFNVSANQTNIPQIQSTYIPWSQYMDSSYTNGNCSDWNASLLFTATHNIPSVAGSKQTQYPDNGSGVSGSCGVLGDVYLGSDTYNINDNVHIRASLCVYLILGCSPTFYNPDPNTIHWVFVEGAINFNSVQTLPGSGPIVFVSYAADPILTAIIRNCPYGGSIYLGNSGTTSAPAAYFIAMNGLCIDKTKFSSNPALGGLSAKNIYIASNPGTPFDLVLDPNYPYSQIPVDLAWRQVSYQRL